MAPRRVDIALSAELLTCHGWGCAKALDRLAETLKAKVRDLWPHVELRCWIYPDRRGLTAIRVMELEGQYSLTWTLEAMALFLEACEETRNVAADPRILL